jgi:hypothetical protein
LCLWAFGQQLLQETKVSLRGVSEPIPEEAVPEEAVPEEAVVQRLRDTCFFRRQGTASSGDKE